MNETIQMFWAKPPLSTLERLSMASFVANGHPVDLYSYVEIDGLPDGVRLLDGRTILSEKELFTSPRAVGYGSYAPFSNRFRYQLLYQRGGIWCDSDVVCARPLDFAATMPYFFASERTLPSEAHPQGEIKIASAAIKAEAGSRLMAECFDAAMAVDPKDIVWGSTGPDLVQRKVLEHQLTQYILHPQIFCPIDYWRVMDIVTGVCLLPQDAYAVHFWNEMWRRNFINKEAKYEPLSLYERLKARFLP